MIKYKGPLFFQFNQFLDSRAEIHQIFALVFWKSHSEINWPSKEILKRENEERQREMRDLEAFSKKENAERKAETENINKILNAENDKRMKEAQALKDKMEKEKKELQAYLEQVWPFALGRGKENKIIEMRGSLSSNNRPDPNALIAVFRLFLVIFSRTMFSSFTKLRFRRSFWGTNRV